MKLYRDKQNNNYYIKGIYDNKEYLFNRVMKFEITNSRTNRIEEIKEDQNIINSIITGVKEYLPYSYNNINFI